MIIHPLCQIKFIKQGKCQILDRSWTTPKPRFYVISYRTENSYFEIPESQKKIPYPIIYNPFSKLHNTWLSDDLVYRNYTLQPLQ